MLLIVKQGDLSIHQGLRHCELHRHDLLLLRPNDHGFLQENHQRENQVCRFPIVLLSPGAPLSPLSYLPELCPVPYPDSKRLDHILNEIDSMTRKLKSEAERVQGTAWIHELLSAYVLTGFSLGLFPHEPRHTPSWVDDARAYIDERHKETDVRLEQIASKVGRAPRTLQEGFRKAYGLSPITYLHQIRILTAKRLIASNPEFTIQYLMSRCGYRNRSQFHRMFVKHVGKSPSAFRAAPE